MQHTEFLFFHSHLKHLVEQEFEPIVVTELFKLVITIPVNNVGAIVQPDNQKNFRRVDLVSRNY